ncbi:MAG: DUF3592 domain-containing protein [Eubacteriales bacterium]|nr:DUF3592 domain-containing protein [Eubacteriales bacterium]
MRNSRILGKMMAVWSGLSFVAVGIFFIVISILILRAPKTDYIPTTATIVDIIEKYDPMDDEIDHQVFVDYKANGKSYRHAALGSYSSSMQVGDRVDIEYAADDPSHIQTPGSGKIVYIVLGVGILSTLGGAVMTVRRFIG